MLLYRLLTVGNKTSEEKGSFLKKLDEFYTKIPENIKQFYGDFFNGVDLSDGIWNSYDWRFQMEDWRAKFFWAIIKHALLNTYALYSYYNEKVTFDNFRPLLLKSIWELIDNIEDK